MPRSTLKTRQNGSVSACDLQPANVISKTASLASDRKNAVKKEPGSATENITDQVFHRKSERRRVARDIFLVFEEQPKYRGSSKKHAKPKFGHLKVGEPLKPKGLLRDIKNEPKCCLSNDSADRPITTKREKKSLVNKEENSVYDVWSSISCPPCNSKCSKIESIKSAMLTQDHIHTKMEEAPVVARVNPIFLWAKQENTRIIEVRCEDYDRRNRIRITKTSNGWRAIPRSDPTSSKVLKLYSSPLIKVKRESLNIIANHISQTPAASNTLNINAIMDVEDKLEKDKVYGVPKKKSKKKKSKKRKQKPECSNNLLPNIDSASEKIQVTASSLSEETFARDYTSKDCCHQNICNIDKNATALKQNTAENLMDLKRVNAGTDQVSSNSLKEIPTYETNNEIIQDDYSFQLCPKTGLFLRYQKPYEDNELLMGECASINILEINHPAKPLIERKLSSIEENSESLEAKTRNLKDLLDDADLFQHCDDNANSDSDLIDTLVKSSCENNLLHDSEACVKEGYGVRQNKSVCDVPKEDEDLAQLINNVDEPPKCLSFNEAGEIEALNCDLFHSNTYIDSFEKQVSMPTISVLETATKTNVEIALDLVDTEKSSCDRSSFAEESPKDLSYKKREEVCPPSESRSQCAVTSSSDVVKSPKLDDNLVLASSSETLKNLILEQFMKLSNISNRTKTYVKGSKEAESISDLTSIYSKSIGTPLTDIETVVIEDDDSAVEVIPNEGECGPLKKRFRSTADLTKHNAEINVTLKAKMAMIDEDPDPLTQLRLLIQNSQWKVPDPILVPKDRLSAVLASPAREIPLLITTRPELRLPEAFAYPEIIQNPNILVISMAQLEAILKNNQNVNKSKASDVLQESGTLINSKRPYHNMLNGIECSSQTQQAKQLSNIAELRPDENTFSSTISENALQRDSIAKCVHNVSALPSDFNAATMAVLNQMLWLPYFNQFSHDFKKSLQIPSNVGDKVSSVLPISRQNLEIIGKTEQNSVSSLHQVNFENADGQYRNSNLPTLLKDGQVDGMTLFQKVLQQQMENVVKLNITNRTSSRKNSTSDYSSPDKSDQFDTSSCNGAVREALNSSAMCLPKNKPTEQGFCNVVDATGKIYNLRSSVASRQNSDANHFSHMKRSICGNKPRVTCKSLSNLLEPDHTQTQSMKLTPRNANLVSNFDNKFQHDNNKSVSRVREQTKESYILKSLTKSCLSKNADNINEYNKHSKNIVDDTTETGARSVEPPITPTETNVPLWHPLFGSNSKSAYSSPWQWTTVTAAGE